MELLKRIGAHTTHGGEPIDSILAAFGYGLGAALNETNGYRTGYRTPLDPYYLRSPIENVWEMLAVEVFAVILLIERDSPQSSYHAEHVWSRLSSATGLKCISLYSPLETYRFLQVSQSNITVYALDKEVHI